MTILDIELDMEPGRTPVLGYWSITPPGEERSTPSHRRSLTGYYIVSFSIFILLVTFISSSVLPLEAVLGLGGILAMTTLGHASLL